MDPLITLALTLVAGFGIKHFLIPPAIAWLAPRHDGLRRLYAQEEARSLEKATHKYIHSEIGSRARFEDLMYNYASQGVGLTQRIWKMFHAILKGQERGYTTCQKERVKAAAMFLEQAEKEWASYFSKKPADEDWADEAGRTLEALFQRICITIGGPT